MSSIFDINVNDFSDIHWRVEESTENSILFYHFRDNSNKSIEEFKKRISNAKFKLCITNVEFDFVNKMIVSVSTVESESLKELFLNHFYPINKDLYFIGITGTNGKTTTVDLIRQMAVFKNINVLTIGTLGVYLNENKENDFSLTTPSYIDLRKTIYQYQDRVEIVAMELSSIALEQTRTGTLLFDALGWTNFSQDHLDYHGSLDEYFKQKRKIFHLGKAGVSVMIPATEKKMTESFYKGEKFSLVQYKDDCENPFFKIEYNRDNLAIAIQCLSNKMVTVTTADIERLRPPPGRANIIEYKDSVIVIDFAHTPDGIRAITLALRKSFPTKKLITLFGCGGDRDKKKRPLMAKAAVENSDFVILTSDNPRFEEPEEIMDDAKKGLTGHYKMITSRKEAITHAVSLLDDAVLLIAGKGHENYLDIKGVKIPYNDYDYLLEIIND